MNIPLIFRAAECRLEGETSGRILGRWGIVEGGRRVAVLYSPLGACRLNGVNLWQWLSDVLVRIHVASDAADELEQDTSRAAGGHCPPVVSHGNNRSSYPVKYSRSGEAVQIQLEITLRCFFCLS